MRESISRSINQSVAFQYNSQLKSNQRNTRITRRLQQTRMKGKTAKGQTVRAKLLGLTGWIEEEGELGVLLGEFLPGLLRNSALRFLHLGKGNKLIR